MTSTETIDSTEHAPVSTPPPVVGGTVDVPWFGPIRVTDVPDDGQSVEGTDFDGVPRTAFWTGTAWIL